MTPRKEKALAALIRAPTIETAARELGIGYSTLRNWLKTDDEFRAEYEKALADIFADASKQACQSLAPAISTLNEIVSNETAPPAVRVQSARVILESALKLAEITDVLSRLEKLEGVYEE